MLDLPAYLERALPAAAALASLSSRETRLVRLLMYHAAPQQYSSLADPRLARG